jgi:hypothetical protein
MAEKKSAKKVAKTSAKKVAEKVPLKSDLDAKKKGAIKKSEKAGSDKAKANLSSPKKNIVPKKENKVVPATKSKGKSNSKVVISSKGKKALEEKNSNSASEYVVLMQQDPQWMHAYWKVNERRKKEAEKKGNALVLRLYDVSTDQTVAYHRRPIREIEIPSDAANWYIRNESPQESQVAVVGLKDSTGEFLPFVESKPASSAPNMEDAMRGWQETMDIFVQASLGGGQFGIGSSALPFKGETTENRGEWLWPSSMGPSSASFLSSVSDKNWNVNETETPHGKDFFLWVKTRLIVYGGTAPDAHLQVRGEEFPLRPDGTFSFEMDLPDSTQIIPIYAEDKDGDLGRSIVPIVVKRTE